MNLTAKNKGFEIFTRPALASGGVEPTRKVARLIRHGEISGGTVALVDQGPRHGPALARRYEILRVAGYEDDRAMAEADRRWPSRPRGLFPLSDYPRAV
jgi:hypothetical protein